MNLNEQFNIQKFEDWIQNFIPDFSYDKRNVDIPTSFSGVKAITTLGESSIGVRVYVIETDIDPSRRKVGFATDSFNLLKNYGTPNAIIAYYSPNSSLWRLSLLTSTPIWSEGRIITKLSNPKRQSYVLGEKAKVKTPHQYLISKGKVADFNDLKTRFSLEVVNKEFYKEISHSFIQLVGGTENIGRSSKTIKSLLKLPSQQDHSQINLEFAVRMIGRIIFCWFLREKKSPSGHSLMPKELISLDASVNTPDYYHTILEPIFFEILNKPIKTRKDNFSNDLFSAIPYLNGGLFSPHDDDYFSYNEGKQAINHNLVVVPDEWFKSLFAVLETYNFTIDENTSFDEELSIDPEMLGRIFENLLAEINPETGESARKSTGSYYTPRVIVDYMVDESLYLYLKDKTGTSEKKLRSLISYDLDDDSQNPLNDEEKSKIAEALGNIKILDPACGSGAFPIGALQKIVFILQQIDQHGQLWFRKQLQNTPIELRRVIEREFQEKNFDYIRKLGIIRENIYGVDIQPIATEISRLRCFLTLVVDERVDDSLENRGIEPLPNLDFKFVTANTLVALPGTQTVNQMGLFEDDSGINELKELRNMFFTASGSERDQLKLQFVQAQNRMFQRLISEGRRGHAELTTKLTTWDPFSHKSASWFDPEWMFGIKDGFNIVIANPPYEVLEGDEWKKFVEYIREHKEFNYSLGGKLNLYRLFIEISSLFLKEGAILTFITPSTVIADKNTSGIRRLFKNEGCLHFVIEFPEKYGVFESVTQATTIFLFEKGKSCDNFSLSIGLKSAELPPLLKAHVSWNQISKIYGDALTFPLIKSNEEWELIKKLYSSGKELKYIAKCYQGDINLSSNKRRLSDEKTDHLLVRGEHIRKYSVDLSTLNTDRRWFDANGTVIENQELNERIVCQNIANMGLCQRIIAGLIPKKTVVGHSANCVEIFDKDYSNQYLLSLLNSKLINWYFKKTSTNNHVNIYELEVLPIKKMDSESVLESTVAKIISIVSLPSYHTEVELEKKAKEYQEEIDKIIYKLYELSPDEIQIIEGAHE